MYLRKSPRLNSHIAMIIRCEVFKPRSPRDKRRAAMPGALSYRQVRRLRRQILQLTCQLDAPNLRDAIQKASARLAERFPELRGLAA